MQSLKLQRVCGIVDCPAEILLLVLQLLSPIEWRTLCLVHRQLRAVAEPLLYSKFQGSWKDPKTPPPIAQFLRTIVSKPELATHVTNVQLEGQSPSNFGSTQSILSIPVSGAELDRSVEFIQRTGVLYSEFWIQQLRKGVIDAFVALLLAQLPNLQQVALGPVFTQRSTLIGMVLSSAICEPGVYRLPGFSQLRDVAIYYLVMSDRARQAENIQNTPDFLPLFYLKNVERISASVRSSAAFKWPTAHLPDPTRLKSLHLTCIRDARLTDILSATQSLQQLSWEWYYDHGLYDEFNKPIVDLDQIATALSHIPPTLRELNISAKIGIGGHDCHYPGIRIEGSLNPMADLHFIKILKVPLAFCVGFVQDTTNVLQDVLPRNLEFLTLTYDLSAQEDPRPEIPEWDWEDWAVLGLLKSWLSDRELYTPCLRRILLTVESPEEHIGIWDSDMMLQLSDLSSQTGIKIDVKRQENCWRA